MRKHVVPGQAWEHLVSCKTEIPILSFVFFVVKEVALFLGNSKRDSQAASDFGLVVGMAASASSDLFFAH
jgi:hypothetical protein